MIEILITNIIKFI